MLLVLEILTWHPLWPSASFSTHSRPCLLDLMPLCSPPLGSGLPCDHFNQSRAVPVARPVLRRLGSFYFCFFTISSCHEKKSGYSAGETMCRDSAERPRQEGRALRLLEDWQSSNFSIQRRPDPSVPASWMHPHEDHRQAQIESWVAVVLCHYVLRWFVLSNK